MKKRVLTLCLASFFSVNAFALVPPGNDVTTKPDLYYLTITQPIDILSLLPPPPAVLASASCIRSPWHWLVSIDLAWWRHLFCGLPLLRS